MNPIVSLYRIVKYTHRHPVNQLLHCAGVAAYIAAGLAVILGNPVGATAMAISAVSMLVVGHAVEGNLGSMMPVLVARLGIRLLRSGRNPKRNDIHLV